MGLFPASFAAIRRDGVAYAPLEEAPLLRLRLGLVADMRRMGACGVADAVFRHLGRPPESPC